MKKYIDPKKLEDGKVLVYLKHKYVEESTEENIYPLLGCLRDSQVLVPMNVTMSEEDEAMFKNADVGDVVQSKGDIRLIPDILQNDDKYYFPMFSNKEQMPEDYANHFSIIDLSVVQCIEMAKNIDKLSGLVIDAFTEPMVIKFDLADVIMKLESSCKE